MRLLVLRLLYVGVTLGFALIWLFALIQVQLFTVFLIYCPYGELPFEVGLLLFLIIGGVYLLYADLKTV